MGIDLNREKAVSLAQAARHLPPGRNGRPVHVSTLVRAITAGVGGVKLEALRFGRRWVTTVEAVQRWGEALAAANGGESRVAPTANREGDDARVERRIGEIGL